MRKTFIGGVHLEEHKELSCGPSIKKAAIPKRVFIPLSQHTGAPAQSLVKPGDAVKTGEEIAESDKYISSPVHSSITGKVTKIDKSPHSVLGEYDSIIIDGDGTDEPDPSIKESQDTETLSNDRLRNIIKNAGIVGMGGAAFPTHVKLKPPDNKPIDTLILNGAECEPYLTSDHRLMLERSEEIIEGLKIIKKIVGAGSVYIAIESNKADAALKMKETASRKQADVKVVILKTKYPQGSEKQLIKVIANREIPPGGLPLDVGCLVQNVGTALSIYEAVQRRKPLYERVVTITGDCVKEPANLLARIGTPFGELVEQCGGFSKDPAKVIVGGPMMGLAQFSLDIPVMKGTTGVVFLSKDEAGECQELSCIRCARCVDTCPVSLVPADIFRLVKRGDYRSLEEYNIADCIECGCCAYECPSKIPLVQWIKLGKQELLKLEPR